MDVITQAQRRKNMQAIKSKGTKAEVKLAKELWGIGYRYRKNDKSVFGKPDLTFKQFKLAVFVDSEYFHGWNWEIEKHRIQSNQAFWWKKIEGNMERDKLVNEVLLAAGWKVVRFWCKEINNDLQACITKIKNNME